MLLLLLACATDASYPTFATGGTPQDISALGDTGGAGDTGGGGEDTASTGDEGAPSLLALTALFVDIPNVGVALEVFITFDDANSTLVGGKVYPTFTGAVSGVDTEAYDIGDYNLGEVDQAFVDPDSGALFFAIVGIDETDSYDVDAYVIDSTGLTSNTISGTADPY